MRAALRILALALVLAACADSDGPPLVAEAIEITPPMPGANMSAGYLRLRNQSRDAIRITRITSPQFGRVEIHESLLENGISRMRRKDELLVPAGDVVALERGGLHLMLSDPASTFDRLELNFLSGNDVVLTTSTRLEW